MLKSDVARQHEQMLYPVVRVRTEREGGSGTVIASIPDSRCDGEYMTFVLTNAHVIEKAIRTRDDWDSLLKREIKKEFLSPVSVELFSYVYQSRVNSSDSYKAQIVAYDKHHDIAVLKLDTPKKAPHVAKLYPKDKERDIRLFHSVYAVGCSLLHEPLPTKGHVTYTNEIQDDEIFFMSSASIIFGNSGGAIFLADTGEFIGIPAKIPALQLGFGIDMMSFMGMFVPIPRIYRFFEEQELQFLYDNNGDYYDAMESRKRRQKEAILTLSSGSDGKEPR